MSLNFGGAMSSRKAFITFPYEVVEQSATAALSDHTRDVVNIRFKLVYEGANKNGDYFLPEEIRANYDSLVMKPLTWDHDPDTNIGAISKAWLVDGKGEPLHIMCEATVWAHRFPEYADAIIASAKLGEMGLGEAASHAMSMEVYFDTTQSYYMVGDRKIPMTEDTGELSMLKGRTFGNMAVYRVFKNICFGGAGVVEEPGEQRALLLAVASNKALADGKQLFKDLSDDDFALSSKRVFPIDRPERVRASLSYFDDLAQALIQDVSEGELAVAHMRLIEAANHFDVSIEDHTCMVCAAKEIITTTDGDNNMGSNETLATENEKEDCATMADKELEHPVEEVEEAVAEETVEVTEEAAVETPEEAEADIFDVRVAFNELKELLVAAIPTPTEEPAAEASEEKDELTLASERITELEAELESVRADKAAAEANFVGHLRLTELREAGIEVDKEAEASKREFLAGLSDDAYATYLTDVKAVASKTDTKPEHVEEEDANAALLNLENDADESPVDKLERLKSMWKSTSTYSRYDK